MSVRLKNLSFASPLRGMAVRPHAYFPLDDDDGVMAATSATTLKASGFVLAGAVIANGLLPVAQALLFQCSAGTFGAYSVIITGRNHLGDEVSELFTHDPTGGGADLAQWTAHCWSYIESIAFAPGGAPAGTIETLIIGADLATTTGVVLDFPNMPLGLPFRIVADGHLDAIFSETDGASLAYSDIDLVRKTALMTDAPSAVTQIARVFCALAHGAEGHY